MREISLILRNFAGNTLCNRLFMRRYLKNMFQLVLSPGNGWEDIDKADDNPRDIALKGYYPLIALAAASVFMQGVYHHAEADFLKLLMRMIVMFIVYFVSYFFGVFTLSLFSDPLVEGGYDERRSHTFTLYTLGLLSMIALIVNCLPVTKGMLFFLPFYVALVQWKGVKYMDVKPGKEGLFMIIAIPGVLMPPYIFYILFSHIIG